MFRYQVIEVDLNKPGPQRIVKIEKISARNQNIRARIIKGISSIEYVSSSLKTLSTILF